VFRARGLAATVRLLCGCESRGWMDGNDQEFEGNAALLDRPGSLPEESYREITETWLAAVDAAQAAEIEAGRSVKTG
jgi:hypothetical protein